MQVVLDFTEEILAGSIFFGMMYITVALKPQEDRDGDRGTCTGVSSLLLCKVFFII